MNGMADPTPATGADGDFYINTQSMAIFGPKLAGTWPPGIPLSNSPGAQGARDTRPGRNRKELREAQGHKDYKEYRGRRSARTRRAARSAGRDGAHRDECARLCIPECI